MFLARLRKNTGKTILFVVTSKNKNKIPRNKPNKGSERPLQ
jgi:hypothetical protein